MPTKRKMTPQQRALMKHRLAGHNITESARLAGYADNGYVGQIGSQAIENIRLKMPEVLDAHGLTDDVLVEKYLKELMNAESTEFAKKDGIITDERKIAAWDARRAGLDMALSIKGSYAAKEVGSSSTHITINTLIVGEKAET